MFYRTNLTFVLALTACAPGKLWVDGDREVLRTALVRQDRAGGVDHAAVVLSNGLFECNHEIFEDPARAQQAIQSLITAGCREGAKHLNLQMWRDKGRDWVGQYEGIAGGGPIDLDSKRSRIVDATYYTVDEAYLAEYFEGVDRIYAVEEETWVLGASDGGTVDIEADDGERLTGSVWLPNLDLYAQFDAEWCAIDASLFAMIEASPAYVCP